MLDILGIGDAIVDRVIPFDASDPIMEKILSVKGLFFKATEQEHSYLRAKKNLSSYAGGSAANTIRCMSVLGMKTGFLGKVGEDKDGSFFQDSLTEYGVCSYLIETSVDVTGCSVVIVHEDKDRTQCALPCASNLLTCEDISDQHLKNTYSVIMEGYMLNRLPDLVAGTIRRAHAHGVKVYFTLSDVHCVLNKKELITTLLPEIDVLFGNEYEFNALDLNPCLLKKTTAVKTCAGKGVFVLTQNKKFHFPVSFVDKIVNTNGAGDAFAAGFLTAFHKKESFEKCVCYGHEVAASVLRSELSYLPLTDKRCNSIHKNDFFDERVKPDQCIR